MNDFQLQVGIIYEFMNLENLANLALQKVTSPLGLPSGAWYLQYMWADVYTRIRRVTYDVDFGKSICKLRFNVCRFPNQTNSRIALPGRFSATANMRPLSFSALKGFHLFRKRHRMNATTLKSSRLKHCRKIRRILMKRNVGQFVRLLEFFTLLWT